MSKFTIRKIKEYDQDFIIELSTRFTEFDFMKWRNVNKMKQAQLKMAREAFVNTDEHSNIFIVEDEELNTLGFLHMKKHIDYFTGEEQGYISSIAVSKDGEGKGIAKLLMKKAEEWSKSRGFKRLTLDVFSNNERAVQLYSKLNFESEIIKMVKDLDE